MVRFFEPEFVFDLFGHLVEKAVSAAAQQLFTWLQAVAVVARRQSMCAILLLPPRAFTNPTPLPCFNRKAALPVVLFRTGFRNTVWDVMSARSGWKSTDRFVSAGSCTCTCTPLCSSLPSPCNYSELDWDVIWADVGWVRENFDRIHLDDHQRVNHFRNHYELTRKDLLVKNVNRMKKQVCV